MPRTQPKYQQVAEHIQGLVQTGSLQPGAKVPSVRQLSRQREVSVTTVLEAYRLLEDRGIIQARPQSGYYVRRLAQALPLPAQTESAKAAADLDVGDMILTLVESIGDCSLIPFGAAVPHASFLPTKRLNRLLGKVARNCPEASQAYDVLAGREDLRVQIARRGVGAGMGLSPDDIVITAGAQEALSLCLRAVTKPGDTVIIETPTYYGLLDCLQGLYLKALEVGTSPCNGVCLDELEKALKKRRVAACVLAPNFGNPLGHCMPDEKKQRLVDLLARFDVPLIEDDTYGDLSFSGDRPRTAKSFDKQGKVLLCSSFSKTLAPGYRIGWMVPGIYKKQVKRLKFSTSVATATPTQMAVAEYLSGSGYDRYLRKLRRTYQDLMRRFTGAIASSFPQGTLVTRPQGGFLLWVQLPDSVNAISLVEQARKHGITIAPGPIFSATGRYQNFVRLNVAAPWSDRVQAAIATLGRLAHEAVKKAPPCKKNDSGFPGQKKGGNEPPLHRL